MNNSSFFDESVGMDMRGAYTGPTAEWQSFDNALITLPVMQEWPGKEHLHLVVMVHPDDTKSRGLFRDCRWDFEAMHFVDHITGEVYAEEDVVGWTMGVFP